MAKRKAPKHPLHSKFYSTIQQSHRFRAEEGEGADTAPGFEGPEEEFTEASSRDKGRRRGDRSEREDYNINMADAQASVQSNPERAARDLAYYKTTAIRGKPPQVPELDPEFQRPRVSKRDVEHSRKLDRDHTWEDRPDVYRVPSKERKPLGAFIEQEMAPSHRAWLENQLKHPQSSFNKNLNIADRAKSGRLTPGQRKRVQIYTDALQRGEPHSTAWESVNRSVNKETVGRPADRARNLRMDQAREAMRAPGPQGRDTKFKSLAPRANEFKFGIAASHRPSMDDLKKKYPKRDERELVQIRQASLDVISQELLANQKWAHETRRANLLGAQSGGRVKEAPDRVTIFTTNVGHPAVSVPSDSLVGQYIIRKRKAVFGSHGVPASQLKGKFPDALRDQHVVDIAAGTSWAVQGRQGVMSTTGYRFGKKASPGYGKPKPLGSQILYDTAGRPVYNSQGDIVYTEGATRSIDWSTPSVGLRVLIG